MPTITNIYTNDKKKKLPVSFIILLVICIIVIVGSVYYKNIFPNQLLNYGKKYMEIKQFDNALRIFRYLGNIRPKSIEPLYYEVLTLSKMPPTYENQRRLYEISQYDDCDEASTLAEEVLSNIRIQIDKQAGNNYIDNVLYEDIVVRWNNTHPITYSVSFDAPMKNNLLLLTEKAFSKWQSATSGEFKFQKILGNSNIVIHVVYKLPEDKRLTTEYSSAVTIANTQGYKLNRMDIYIKATDDRGNQYDDKKLYYLLLHEIGHALGLGGHSALEQDVMYIDGDYVSNKMIDKDISKRDLNTLNLLYKMVPDVIDIDLPDNIKNNLLYHEIITTYPGENFEIETQQLIQDLKKDKKNIAKWVDLATNYSIKRQYTRANYILERILPIVSNDEDNQFAIYYNMAINYYRMKDFSLARRYLNLAEAIETDNETQMLNSFIDVKEDQLESAKKKLLVLKAKDPENIEIAIKLAEIYHKEKNIKECRKMVQDVIKANPNATRDKRLMKYEK